MEKVCSVADVMPGLMKGFEVAGKKILIANVGGSFYAMDAVCSHMGGYLPHGKLNGDIVICPLHHTNFNVKTGEVVKNVSKLIKVLTGRTASNLKVYKVKIEKGDVLVTL